MHNWERRILRIGLVLLLIGAVLSAGAFAVNGFTFDGLVKGTAYEQVNYMPEGEFDRIDVSAVDAEIHIQPSQDGICRVVCDEREDAQYSVEVQNGVLTVYCEDNWRAGIHIKLKTPQLLIELPEKDYAELKVQSVSGDVDVMGLCIDALAIETTSGEVELEKLTLDGLDVETVSGGVDMEGCAVTGDFRIRTTSGEVELEKTDAESFCITTVSGDVKLENTDGASFEISTTSGEVEGTLRSGKTFDVHSVSGDVKVPESVSGGMFRAKTTSGDVEIRVK